MVHNCLAFSNSNYYICGLAIDFSARLVGAIMDAFKTIFCRTISGLSFENSQDVPEISEG